MTIQRIAQSFVIPILALVAVPALIHVFIEPMRFMPYWSQYTGMAFILTGLSFLAWANTLLVAHGDGTSAPWDAPKKLIILGPYRYVRNPISVSLITTLWGATLVFGSFYLLLWSGLLWLIQHSYIVLVEEKTMRKRFGRVYEKYTDEVPRWLPLGQPVAFDP